MTATSIRAGCPAGRIPAAAPRQDDPPACPTLRLVPQPDGGPPAELRAGSSVLQVRAETGGAPLRIARGRRRVRTAVTSHGLVMGGVIVGGGFRNNPLTGAEQQDPDGGLLNMQHPPYNAGYPPHPAFRRPVNLVFTRTAAEAGREETEAAAREIARSLHGRAAADLIAGYIDPFIRAMVCRSLGLDDWENIEAGSNNAFSPVHGRHRIADVNAAWQETYEFYSSVVTKDLAHPDGTVAQLEHAVRATLNQLTHLLGNVGNGYPAAKQAARRAMWEIAAYHRADVAACLRGESSWELLVGLVLNTTALYPIDLPRLAVDDVYLDGELLFAAGEYVLPSLAAAGNDPDAPPALTAFEDVAFSWGPYRCPGGWLTRMWIETAVKAWWETHPRSDLDNQTPVWVGDSLAAPTQIMVTGLS